jgi:folate-binding protein YgfZ
MCFGIEATEMTKASFQAGCLPDRAVLRIAGADARYFLDNLLTAEIETLSRGSAAYTALLTPQGKILFDFFVYDNGEEFLIDCAAAQRDELAKRLTFYRLRAKLEISMADDLRVNVSAAEPQERLRYVDPRLSELGWRAFVANSGVPAQGYDIARIVHGLADSADIGSGETFPHEANFDQFGGVSFSKGCYVGQEVVSRMEHRGTARTRMLPVSLTGAAPPKGSEIKSGDKVIGTLLSSKGEYAMALLRLDRLGEASLPLLTNGVAVTVHKPGWVRYDVPGAISP